LTHATALDTEFVPATNSEPVGRLVCVQYADGSIDVAHRVEWDRVAHAWRTGIVLAMSPADAFTLWRARPELGRDILDAYEAGRVFDVLTREKMLSAAYGDSRESFGLDAVAKHRAGILLDKANPWRLRYAELLGYELEQWPADAIEYARMDAIVTQRVFDYQQAEGFAFDGTVHAQAHLALYAQTLRGIHTDAERVAALDASIGEKIDRIAWGLMRAGLLVLEDKRKPVLKAKTEPAHAMMEQWCASRGIEPVRAEKGGISLADKALHAARVPDDHPLIKLARFKSYRSLRTSRIPAFRRPIVRTRYDEYKKTARTGSSAPQGDTPIAELDAEQWVGGNFQNMARPDTLVNILGFDEGEGFRECLVPPPGHVFVVSDYPQLELRTHAQILIRLHRAGLINVAPVLAEIMNDPSRDLHAEVGAQIAGVPLSAFDVSITEHKRCRQLAKPVNFGLPGGLGPQRLCDFAWSSSRIEISIEQAKQYKAIWQRTLPEMPQYFRWIDSLKTGAMTSGGAPLYRITVPGTSLARTCKRNDACNFGFQGPAALIAKLSLWYLFRAGLEPSSPMFGAYQVLFVHDENVTVCRREAAEQVAREQERLMTLAASVYMPDVRCVVAGSAILDRYGK
jgi:hypothetical protein